MFFDKKLAVQICVAMPQTFQIPAYYGNSDAKSLLLLFTSIPIKNSTPLTSPSGLAAITSDLARENVPSFLGMHLYPTFFGNSLS